MSMKYLQPASGDDVGFDTVAGEQIQQIKTMFGGSTQAKRVTEGVPLPARDYHGGTVPVDYGLQVVAQGAAVLVTTAADHWLDVLLLVNATDQSQAFAFTDGAGAIYGGQDLAPKELRAVALHGLKFAGGAKLGADVAAAVYAQVKGTR